ncbi:MAG TPA: hypothetical protein VFG56_02595 [Candidatus Saccharimonadales bacterium]|nr:hypothetical protein [Candidatus Saccharimonadales bacterium]
MLVANFRLAVNGWRDDPIKMTARLTASALIGQTIFWKFGYDQLGVGMRPQKEFGQGRRVAAWAATKLTLDLQTAVALKVVEVLTDFGKGPLEAACYRRCGVVPDALAFVVTQPLWSTFEAFEKSVSAVSDPRRLATPEQIELSLACIYGSLFRYGQAAILLLVGKRVNRLIVRPIEAAIRELLGK